MKIGLYCGEKFFSRKSWSSYPLFKRVSTGFSVGPVLFWDGS